jgi:hypothetical protein
MLVLQLMLYWIGLALIGTSAWRRGRPRLGIALACAGLLPAPFALTGTVTKDALMAGLLLCAVGLLLWRAAVRPGSASTALTLGTLLALLFASALRFNAFFACVPLALAALPRAFTRTKVRLLATTLVATAAFMATGPAVAKLVQAEDTDVQLSLMIFDLGGITEHSGVSQFPDMGVKNPVAVNHRCYDPVQWDSYSTWAKTPCPLGFEPFQALIDDDDVDAKALWIHAILSHPIAYAEHRLDHFNRSTFFLIPEGPTFTAWSQSVPNPWAFHIRDNRIVATVTAITNAAALTPLGWPIFWISIALAALVLAAASGLRRELIAIAASPFLYGAGFLFVGVATGMRYHFWTISGAAVAALLVGGELWPRRTELPRTAVIVAAIVVIAPTALAIAARLALS